MILSSDADDDDEEEEEVTIKIFKDDVSRAIDVPLDKRRRLTMYSLKLAYSFAAAIRIV